LPERNRVSDISGCHILAEQMIEFEGQPENHLVDIDADCFYFSAEFARAALPALETCFTSNSRARGSVKNNLTTCTPKLTKTPCKIPPCGNKGQSRNDRNKRTREAVIAASERTPFLTRLIHLTFWHLCPHNIEY